LWANSLALDGMERSGALGSRSVGSTREYETNPRYPIQDELRTLLEKAATDYAELLIDLGDADRAALRWGKPRQNLCKE